MFGFLRRFGFERSFFFAFAARGQRARSLFQHRFFSARF